MDERTFLDILHTAGRLKDTLRHSFTAGGRPESVAEHCWRVSLMALLLRHEFPEADMDRVVRMCLIHDLGECFTGDIPSFDKTTEDQKKEDLLQGEWVAALPPELSRDLSDLYGEMEALETFEAKLYKALDQLEAVIQHNEAPLETWSALEYTLNQTYGEQAAGFSRWLTGLREYLHRETIRKIGGEQDPIRFVTAADEAGWFALDAHLPEAEFSRKVRDRQGLVLLEDDRIIGILRWNLFWDEIPFCSLLHIAEDRRSRGYGTLLMSAWEREMAEQGFDMLMTSTQSDETAQHFYRKLGYRDSGGFNVDIPGREQPLELVFLKGLGQKEGSAHGI